jgi:hypothetical protein
MSNLNSSTARELTIEYEGCTCQQQMGRGILSATCLYKCKAVSCVWFVQEIKLTVIMKQPQRKYDLFTQNGKTDNLCKLKYIERNKNSATKLTKR